ncbi:MAG: YrhK family protein [Pseudomonadota bacterium]
MAEGTGMGPERASQNRRQRFFEPPGAGISARARRIHAVYELAYTLAEFSAAACFVIGSLLFFWPSDVFAGTWFFFVGSVLFAIKPTLRLLKELALVREGRTGEIGGRDPR